MMPVGARPDVALPLADFMAALPDPAPWGARQVPKVIWMFWHSGLADAPEVVHRSLATWRHFNPDHKVRFLDLADAATVLGVDLQALFQKLTVDLGWTGKSDIIRMMILAKHGGIWADATTFCLKPLSDWLHDEIRPNGFFCFRWADGASDREMISWFLASIPGHPLAVRTLDRSQEFIFEKRDQTLTIGRDAKVLKILRLKPGERPGVEALRKCENRIKKTSYFWMFFIFKTVLDFHPRERNFLRTRSNNFVQKKSTLDAFRLACVSKQTYKPIAQKTQKKRIELLFDGAKVRLDFYTRPVLPHWSQIKSTLAISELAKIIFVHIPKCGGTSVKNSELFEGGGKPQGHHDYTYFHKILGPRFAEFRLLTFVRNPWDRLASAFHFASVHAASRDPKNTFDLLRRFENDLGRFLGAFCENPQKFIKILWFRPAVAFFNPPDCDIPYFIQKLEDKGNLAPLRQFLAMPDFKLAHKRKSARAPLPQSAFTEDIFRKVGEIYAADVQAFGYQNTTIASLEY